jgi:hypothetical protein
MTLHKLESLLTATLDALRHEGRLKGTEHVITGMCPPERRGWATVSATRLR